MDKCVSKPYLALYEPLRVFSSHVCRNECVHVCIKGRVSFCFPVLLNKFFVPLWNLYVEPVVVIFDILAIVLVFVEWHGVVLLNFVHSVQSNNKKTVHNAD